MGAASRTPSQVITLPQGRGTPRPRRSSSLALTAVFPFAAKDFPPSLTDLSVDAITLLVIRRPESSLAFTVDHRDGPPTDPSLSTSVDGIVSTRSGSGAPWLTLTGPTQRPDATWEGDDHGRPKGG